MTKKLKIGLTISIVLVIAISTGLILANQAKATAAPAISFTKSVDKTDVYSSDTTAGALDISYTIAVANDHQECDGSYPAFTGTITDDLSGIIDYVDLKSADADDGIILNGSNQLVWTGISLPCGQSITKHFTLTVKSGTTDGTKIENEAKFNYSPVYPTFIINNPPQDFPSYTVTSNKVTTTVHDYCGDTFKNANEQCDDGNTTNGDGCSSDCKIEIQKTPTFTITKMDNPDPVAAGSNLTYTLNFTISDADATGVVLTDTIPANTTFVSASDPGKYNALTNKVTWNYGNLKMGNYVVILVVKVYSPLANKTVINNTATLTSTEKGELKASSDTTVSTAPILKMEKLVDKTSTNAGDTVNYTIKVTNSGTDAAYNVKLTDVLPNGFTFTDGKNTLNYSFGNIEAGKSVATTYAVKIDSAVSAGSYLNSATLTSTNHSSLTASAKIEVTLPKVLGEETVVTPAPVEEIKVLGAEEELPATGTGILTILSGIILTGTGFYLRKK